MKKLLNIALLISASIFAMSCDENINPDNKPGDNTDETVNVQSVTIEASQDTLLVGDTLALAIQVLPENATNKAYELSVNEDGKKCVKIIDNTHIVGLKAGTAHITATAADNGKSSSIKVIVKAKPTNPDDEENPDDKPVVPEVEAFDFAITVDGIDVTIDITTDMDSTYYFIVAQSYLFDNASEMSTSPRAYMKEEINTLLSEGATLSELLITGNTQIKFSHEDANALFHNEYYTVFAIVIKEADNTQGWDFGTNSASVEFQTEARGSYEGEENILTLDATATANSISVKVDATTSEQYYIACMTYENYFNDFIMFEDTPCYTDTEIMNQIYNHYNGNHIYEIDVKVDNGDKEITFNDLEPNTEYCIMTFCYSNKEDALKPTTPLYRERITTLSE